MWCSKKKYTQEEEKPKQKLSNSTVKVDGIYVNEEYINEDVLNQVPNYKKIHIK